MSRAARNKNKKGEKTPHRWTFLLPLGAILVLLATLATREVGSLDAGFHLEAGEYILSGNGWPQTDPFTYTVTDRPYIDTSWGYQVILALIHRGFGAPGMVLFHVVLVLAIFVLLYQTVRLGPAAPAPLAVLLLLGVLAAEMRYEVRPELLSYAFLALVLHLLHRHAEGRDSPLWVLPAVFLVWANCHSLFVLGWGAMACFVLGLFLHQRRVDRKLLGWSAASVPIVLINPYGWKAFTFPFTLATRLSEGNPFNQSIGEFVSPFGMSLSEQFPFYPRVPIFAFRILVVLVLLSLLPLLRQKRFWCILLSLPFLYLSFRMVRNIPLAVIACLPGAVWGTPLARQIGEGRTGRRLRRAVIVGVTAVALLVPVQSLRNIGTTVSQSVSQDHQCSS